MVSPEIVVLSVFMTPWTNPTSIQRATSDACASTTRRYRSRYRLGRRRPRVVTGDGVVGECTQQVPVAGRGRVLECAHAQMARGYPGEHRARQRPFPAHLLARGDHRERPRGGDAEAVHGLADEYSRSIGPTAALPSPPRANGVRPDPLR